MTKRWARALESLELCISLGTADTVRFASPQPIGRRLLYIVASGLVQERIKQRESIAMKPGTPVTRNQGHGSA